MSMTFLVVKAIISKLLFPSSESQTFLQPFMVEHGKFMEVSDENYTVQFRIKVIKK